MLHLQLQAVQGWESKFYCFIPVKQVIIASCCFVICWYMVPVQEMQGWCSVSWKMATLLNRGRSVLLSSSCGYTMEPMNICRQMVVAYGADVMSVQQLWKWCCDFANGEVSIIMRAEQTSISIQTCSWSAKWCRQRDMYHWSRALAFIL
jgi:hypothetical protein